jgi:hypothetical protein
MLPIRARFAALLSATALPWLPALTWAHEGHGKPGLHWHDLDVGGVLALAAVVAVSVWMARRK